MYAGTVPKPAATAPATAPSAIPKKKNKTTYGTMINKFLKTHQHLLE